MDWVTIGNFFFFFGIIILGSLGSRLLGVRLSSWMRILASFLVFLLGGLLTGFLSYSNPGLSIPPVAAVSNLFSRWLWLF